MTTTQIFGNKDHVVRDQLRWLIDKTIQQFNLVLAPGVDPMTPDGRLIFFVALSQSEALTEAAKQIAIEKDDPQPAQFSESRAKPRKSKARLAAEAEQIYQEGQRGRWRSRPLGAATA